MDVIDSDSATVGGNLPAGGAQLAGYDAVRAGIRAQRANIQKSSLGVSSGRPDMGKAVLAGLHGSGVQKSAALRFQKSIAMYSEFQSKWAGYDLKKSFAAVVGGSQSDIDSLREQMARGANNSLNGSIRGAMKINDGTLLQKQISGSLASSIQGVLPLAASASISNELLTNWRVRPPAQMPANLTRKDLAAHLSWPREDFADQIKQAISLADSLGIDGSSLQGLKGPLAQAKLDGIRDHLRRAEKQQANLELLESAAVDSEPTTSYLAKEWDVGLPSEQKDLLSFVAAMIRSDPRSVGRGALVLLPFFSYLMPSYINSPLEIAIVLVCFSNLLAREGFWNPNNFY